jgi:urease accessory protein
MLGSAGQEHAVMSATPAATPSAGAGWRGAANLRFLQRDGTTHHQGGASAPLKLMRSFAQASGHCELPLLHTAGGLVGGDQLQLTAKLEPGSRALITSVAAQKVYGTVRRSRRHPQGCWAQQQLHVHQAAGSDLEWLPQELVLYADALYEQQMHVTLAEGASFLAMEVVRLGRTAAGEQLQNGCWRSSIEIQRLATPTSPCRWELVDRLELAGDGLTGEHGMAGEPVFGSLVWAAPQPLDAAMLQTLLDQARSASSNLVGSMACGSLEQGLVARYRGPSSQAARFWFCRLWALIREQRGLAAPQLPRVWPFQEHPLLPNLTPAG